MNRTAKRVLAGGVALAAALGCCLGGVRVYRGRHRAVVPVYALSDLSSPFSQEDTHTDGVVSTEQFQAEYLSDTQTVAEVAVEQGQQVKKGDLLFTYDSTLTEIDLKRKQIEVEQKKIERLEAQKELKKIKTYRPGKPIPGSAHTTRVKGERVPEEVPVYEGLDLVTGDGQQDTPFSYLWKDGFLLSDELLAAAMQGEVDCYVRFYLGGREVRFPEPEPEPEPDPEPEESDPEEPEEEMVVIDPSQEDPDEGEGDPSGSPDASEHPDPGTPGDGSGDGSGSGSEGGAPGDGSESGASGDGSQSGGEDSTGQNGGTPDGSGSAQAGDAVPLRETEHFERFEALYMTLSRTGAEVHRTEEPEEEPYSAYWVYHCQHTVDGYRSVLVSMSVGGIEREVGTPFPPMTDKENPLKQSKPKDTTFKDPGIVYNAAELAAMRREQESLIRDCEVELRLLEVERKQLDRELNNSAVFSALDGVVLELNDPKELEDSQPLLKVSGGGGYLIRGSVSELALDSVKPGQSVSISDWASGESYQGTVQSVSEYPTSSRGWSEGNSNVSYYPFTVTVDGSANLEENNMVDMSYAAQSDGGENSTYVLTSFLRREGSRSYILLERDGKLEQRYVRTGRSLWGMYTEVLGGLEEDLYLAFPYGKNVRAGAATEHTGVEALYGM